MRDKPIRSRFDGGENGGIFTARKKRYGHDGVACTVELKASMTIRLGNVVKSTKQKSR